MKLKLARLNDPAEGRPVIPHEKVYEHIFILGSTGRGKTTALLNLINLLNDIGTIIILDPSGAFAEPARSLLLGSRYITKTSSIRLNPFSRPYLSKSEHVQELVDVINTAVLAFSSNPEITVKMRRIAAEAIVCLDEGTTLEGFANFLDSYLERKKVFEDSKKPRPNYWKEFEGRDTASQQTRMTAERISDRVLLFTKMESIANFLKGKNDFDLPRIVAQKQHHIFNFGGMNNEATAIVGALITNQIQSYYLHQAVAETAPPLFVFIDEIHLFLNEGMRKFLVESRKFNIGFIFSAHDFAQLSDKLVEMIWSSTWTKIYLGGVKSFEKTIKEYYEYKVPKLGKYESVIIINEDGHYCKMYPPPELPPIQNINFLSDGTDDWIFP